MKLVIEARRY